MSMTANTAACHGSPDTATPSPPLAAAGLSDPGQWVDDHGDHLYSYAMFRLRDAAKAQDAVQETFLAALKNRRSFAGNSSERGWLLGILKHKIHDLFRMASRETSFTDLGFYSDEDRDRFVTGGLRDGAWIHALGPAAWPNDAGESLDRDAFWQTFRACASKLPHKVALAFMMRELDGVESRNIRTILNLTEDNLWVMLHRARMALRRCLETNWFNPMRAGTTSSKTRHAP